MKDLSRESFTELVDNMKTDQDLFDKFQTNYHGGYPGQSIYDNKTDVWC